MTQPSFVPIPEVDQVRAARRLQVPGPWSPQRPAELHVPFRPAGRGRGTPGPDQGFALQLAHRFEDRLNLVEGESKEDVLVGCALLAARRAALLGRAPCVHDVKVALSLWGFLGSAPAALVDERRLAFLGVSHDYNLQRALVDRVPEASLLLSPADLTPPVVAEGWRRLLNDTVDERRAVAPAN